MVKIKRPKPRVEVIHHNGIRESEDEEYYYGAGQRSTGYCGEVDLDIPIVIVRSLVALSGLLLVFTGIYSLYPILRSVRNVPLLMLKFYVIFFGLTILLLEGKGFLPEHNGLRKWFYTEFHFLHSIRGKGFYYLLVGTLSLSLLSENVAFLISGALIALLGLVDLALSFFTKRQLKQRGLTIEDLQTTTKVRPTRRDKKDTPIANSVQMPTEDDHLLLDEPPSTGFPFEPFDATDLRQGHYANTTTEVPLPSFEMTSYSDPLKIAYMQNFGR
eukprot:Protomagalhaensia_wolfi_Nauph_80__2927@NODE_3004_length_920_cov_69_236095_g2352_i0_p1_GENE_NODE_3004_length_920_cov_69_236095_g2352_i0NODE_3004_length_920_cov_69_236095_g2352_i0_p1_ORF_typecomplete_len272_score40_20COPI_assoc/PF08507_10/9_1e18TMEM72/PF16054_5/1_7e03TMEM72/PF16054_5/0_0042PepSY_TM/PF03929_16/13PepSY_TM/PF03929_16/36_NODE_3004_length_920_cov_69_236095_g2352_i044859